MTQPTPAPKQPRPILPEADWQQQVIDLARLCGWRVHHCRPSQDSRGRWQTAIQGDPGFPDLVLARDGRVVFAELKTDAPQSKLTAAQDVWRIAVGGGVEWYCWRPQDFETVRVVLGRYDQLALTEDVEVRGPWRNEDQIDTGGKT